MKKDKVNTGKFSQPVFRAETILPSSLVTYVQARANHFFKPHKTYLVQSSAFEICLVQEFPLSSPLRETLRDFQRLSAQTHRLLYEIAIEEHTQKAQEFFRLQPV